MTAVTSRARRFKTVEGVDRRISVLWQMLRRSPSEDERDELRGSIDELLDRRLALSRRRDRPEFP